MIKVKTSKLTGHALDYAVAIAEGYGPDVYLRSVDIRLDVKGKCCLLNVPINREYVAWPPSTNWAQGGPILHREEIGIKRRLPCMKGEEWEATGSISAKGAGYRWACGPSPLVAAMRCYVASKLGDAVEIPPTLTDQSDEIGE